MKMFFLVSFVLTLQVQALAANHCVNRYFDSLQEVVAECSQDPGIVTQYHYTGGEYENPDLDGKYEFSTYYFNQGSRSCFTGDVRQIPLSYYPDYPIEYNTMLGKKSLHRA